RMHDAELGDFSLSDRDAVGDGRWWGGEPIWTTAQKAGLRSATMYWPGSEAEINGVRPTQWRAFDAGVDAGERVDQVLAWLDQPAATRPPHVALYVQTVKSAGRGQWREAVEVPRLRRRRGRRRTRGPGAGVAGPARSHAPRARDAVLRHGRLRRARQRPRFRAGTCGRARSGCRDRPPARRPRRARPARPHEPGGRVRPRHGDGGARPRRRARGHGREGRGEGRLGRAGGGHRARPGTRNGRRRQAARRARTLRLLAQGRTAGALALRHPSPYPADRVPDA